MGDIGNKLLDPSYEPAIGKSSKIEVPYFKKILKCPVRFTDDIMEYIEAPEFLDMKLRPLQRKFIEELFSRDSDGKYKYEQGVMCCGMRGGKSLLWSTLVLMYDGTLKKIEDIQVGEQVMGPDSTPRTVITTSRGESEMYKIEQSAADTYVVNDIHILSLKKAQSVNCSLGKDRKANKRYGSWPGIVNMPIGTYLEQSKKWKYFFRGYKAGLIKFKEQPVPIDPYLLGVWQGDGTSTQPEVTNSDQEIIDWLQKYCEDNNLRLSTKEKVENNTFLHRICKGNNDRNLVWGEFKKLNLVKNKHIPQIYISNSKEIRLQVLAGIIDTDGWHRADRHGYDIGLANKVLAYDVKRLADTLGYRTHIKEKKTTNQNPDFKGKAWRLSIYGDVWEIPCKVKRKQYIHNGKHSHKEKYLSSLKVTSIGWGKYAGIGVDKDNLYCLSDGTVTHNTYSSAFIQTFMTQYMLQFDQPAKHFGQVPGTRLTGQVIASSEVQSQETAYAAVETIINYSPWWKKYLAYLLERESNEGKNTLYQKLKLAVEFPEKNIAILCLHSNSAALAGKTSYCVVLDELSRFDVSEGGVQGKTQKQTANAVYDTVVRACSSLKDISKVVTISSPMFENDYTMRLLCRAKDCYVGEMAPVINVLRDKQKEKVPTIYGMHATSFELNPKTKENPVGFVKGVDFEGERVENPETYKRDYLAVPPATVNPFFELPERIDRVVEDREKLVVFTDRIIEETIRTETSFENRFYVGKKVVPLRRDHMNRYYICVDQGEKRDTFALAMGHVEELTIKGKNQKGEEEDQFRLKVIIDIVEGWVPDRGNRITVSFSNVEEVIKMLAVNFNVSTVTYDQWSSVEAIQRLFAEGIYTKQLGANLEMYDVLKQLIYQGQVVFPNHPGLVKELKQLTLIKSRKVDHPVNGCFTGDTKIKLLNGKAVSLKELALEGRDKEFWVYSSLEDGTIVPAKAYNAHKTKEVDELVIVTLDNNKQMRCSLDHLYRLKDGSYKEAEDLTINDSLMPLYTRDASIQYKQEVKSIEIIKLEKPIEVYDITVPEYNNFALESGVFVHNSKDYADAVCRVIWLCYEDYILDTIHGNHILPLKQNLPTLRSIASAHEMINSAEVEPQGAIWDQAHSGAGVFGETFIVRQNIMPNIKSK